MSAQSDAERYADSRPGMDLVDYAEVGLPCWTVLARCQILARKDISAFDETILNAVALGVSDPQDLEIMLGLDEKVLEPLLAELVNREWLDSNNDVLHITAAGGEALDKAVQIVSREVVVPFDYDGLLRQPLTFEKVIDRAAGRRQGLRAVPGFPEDPPDISELKTSKQAITTTLRALRSEHRHSELLAISGIDRRDPAMLPATALVFAPPGRGTCEVALVVEGELSSERSGALANAGQIPRLGLDRTLRELARQPLAPSGPASIRADIDAEAELTARRRLTDAVRDADAALTDDTAAEKAVTAARRALARVAPRIVMPYEHDRLLDVAVGTSRERLLIAGGRLTQRGVNDSILGRLRRTAGNGVPVTITYDTVVDGHQSALRRLKALASDYPSVIVERREDPGGDHILISDGRWVVCGAFDWLGHTGAADRPLGDRRSILINERATMDALWAAHDGRPAPPPTSGKRNLSKSRPRRRRPRRR